MGLFPEKEPGKNYIERPDEASPLSIEHKEVATSVPSSFKAQVTDDSNKQLIQTPESAKIDIVIPVSGIEEIEHGSKGSTSDSITWFYAFWKKIIKKAVLLGRKYIFKK